MSDPIGKLLTPGVDKVAELLDRHRRELEQAISIAADLAYKRGYVRGYDAGLIAGQKLAATKPPWPTLSALRDRYIR